MDEVKRGVDKVRDVRKRNIESIFGEVEKVDERKKVNLIEIEIGEGLLDKIKVEEENKVMIDRNNLGKGSKILRIIEGREGIFEIIVEIKIVEIEIENKMKGEINSLKVKGGEDGMVMIEVIKVDEIIRDR